MIFRADLHAFLSHGLACAALQDRIERQNAPIKRQSEMALRVLVVLCVLFCAFLSPSREFTVDLKLPWKYDCSKSILSSIERIGSCFQAYNNKQTLVDIKSKCRNQFSACDIRLACDDLTLERKLL